jgi:hypothetical protein
VSQISKTSNIAEGNQVAIRREPVLARGDHGQDGGQQAARESRPQFGFL